MQLNSPVDSNSYFIPLTDLDVPFSWNDYFGNDHPVEIDVGSGRGKFLVNSALKYPEINYVGIEIDFREGHRAANRLQKREMKNARVWGGDVKFALGRVIPADSVSAIHVYFPDPWWKRKHRRRRIFTDQFVDLCARVLVPKGLMYSRTDVGEYFGVISSLMNHDSRFETLPLPEENTPKDDLDYRTSFEKKAHQAGTEIWRGLWRLKSPPN